jgi:hypothetical protein
MPEPTATSSLAGFQVATDPWPVLKWPQVAAFGWPPRVPSGFALQLGSDGWYRGTDPNNQQFQVSYKPGVGYDYSNPYVGTGVLADNLDNGVVPQSLGQAVALYENRFAGVPIATLSASGVLPAGYNWALTSGGWYRAPDPNDSQFQVSFNPGVGWDYSNPYIGVGVVKNNLDNGAIPQSLTQAVQLYQGAFGGVPAATLAGLPLGYDWQLGSDGWYRATDPNGTAFQVSYQPGSGFDYSNPSLGIGVLANSLDAGRLPQSLGEAVHLFQEAYGGVPAATLQQYSVSAVGS